MLELGVDVAACCAVNWWVARACGGISPGSRKRRLLAGRRQARGGSSNANSPNFLSANKPDPFIPAPLPNEPHPSRLPPYYSHRSADHAHVHARTALQNSIDSPPPRRRRSTSAPSRKHGHQRGTGLCARAGSTQYDAVGGGSDTEGAGPSVSGAVPEVGTALSTPPDLYITADHERYRTRHGRLRSPY
jgi:hypothetical protein